MTIFVTSTKMVKSNNCNGFEVWARSAQLVCPSSAFSTRYLMEHNANVATVGPANILRRRPEVNIYAASQNIKRAWSVCIMRSKK